MPFPISSGVSVFLGASREGGRLGHWSSKPACDRGRYHILTDASDRSSFANGAFGEQGRHEAHGMRLEIQAPGAGRDAQVDRPKCLRVF